MIWYDMYGMYGTGVNSETKLSSLETSNASGATARQQLETATSSNNKMKQLLLRANKHIEENKRRMQTQATHAKELRAHVSFHTVVPSFIIAYICDITPCNATLQMIHY